VQIITPQTRSDKGVTLIELLVVLVIAAILVGGIYTLFMTQQRSYSVQDQVTGVQQDARIALTFIARDIRMAGFVTGAGSSSGFTDGTPTPFAINGSFNYAVNPTNSTTAPDTLTVVLGIEEWGGVTAVADNVVTLDLGSTVDSSAIYVAFDLFPGRLFNASNADDGDNIITAANVPSGDKIVGGKAYGVKAITYSVGADGILRRNENTGAGAEPLAGDSTTTFVEDLQFAYQVDGDVTNWYNDPSNFPAGMTAANISMVRTTIIVRTVVPDPEETGFSRPDCEDRTGDNSNPGCRRRAHQTVVKVRNI
jgi:prepilin-type N-terminal cleavage/methylation domain-containing protein